MHKRPRCGGLYHHNDTATRQRGPTPPYPPFLPPPPPPAPPPRRGPRAHVREPGQRLGPLGPREHPEAALAPRPPDPGVARRHQVQDALVSGHVELAPDLPRDGRVVGVAQPQVLQARGRDALHASPQEGAAVEVHPAPEARPRSAVHEVGNVGRGEEAVDQVGLVGEVPVHAAPGQDVPGRPKEGRELDRGHVDAP